MGVPGLRNLPEEDQSLPDLRPLFEQVDSLESEIVALERDLVRIPSVNTGFMPTGGETAVCEYIRDWLAEDGIASEILGRTPERGNIIARIEGSKPGRGSCSCPIPTWCRWRMPPSGASRPSGPRWRTAASMDAGRPTARGC